MSVPMIRTRNHSLRRYLVLAACVASACGTESPFVELTAEMLRSVRPSVPPTEKGKTATLLATGEWLVTGGEETGVPISAAGVLDVGTGRVTPIDSLHHARSGHTATVLPDGSVVVLGGIGPDGRIVVTAERFDPATRRFVDMEALDVFRAEHDK